jgi:hypothetical protein
MKMTNPRGWTTIRVRSLRNGRGGDVTLLGLDDDAPTPVPRALWVRGEGEVGREPPAHPALRCVLTSHRCDTGAREASRRRPCARARAGGGAPEALAARTSRPSGRTSPLAFAWMRLLHTYAMHLDPPITCVTLHVLPSRAYFHFRIYAPLTTNDVRTGKDTQVAGRDARARRSCPCFLCPHAPSPHPCRCGRGVDAVSDSDPLHSSPMSHCRGADGDNEDDEDA